MKYIITLLITSLIWPVITYGQIEDREATDTVFSRESYTKKKSSFRKVKTRYGLVDLGVSALYSPTTYRLDNGIDPFELRLLKSTNFNLHFVQQRVSLIDRQLNVVYGLTLESHRYFFDNPVVLLEDTPEVTFDFRSGVNFKKNRLTYNYLTVPFMINFKSNPRYSYRSFHLSAGGFAGLLLGANFKTKVKGSKEKVRDNFALNTFRYGIRTEIGYGPLIFYSTYTLNNLFDKDKDGGYEVSPFTIGLVIWPF
ncbi:MAG: outer membrane beta-barrel protein [Saprospiraceae bacterium]|nr:outer membrane beta-barrel protein [Saprospiraceae bacterium]